MNLPNTFEFDGRSLRGRESSINKKRQTESSSAFPTYLSGGLITQPCVQLRWLIAAKFNTMTRRGTAEVAELLKFTSGQNDFDNDSLHLIWIKFL